jgi:hypothetical protein
MPQGLDLKKEFISSRNVFDRMLALGWVDGFGRQLSWDFWNRYWSQTKRGRQQT